MTRTSDIIRFLTAGGLLFAGCMPVFHHDLARTPLVALGELKEAAAEDHVWAFRIDSIENHWGHEGSSFATHAQIRPVAITAAGEVSAQRVGDIDYGWEAVGCADTTSRSVAIRLYRPGFATVELPRGPGPLQVAWQKAADWRDQERAVEALLAPPTTAYARAKYGAAGGPLLWINTNPKYQEPLLFAAEEYERIANLVPRASPDDRLRLLDKGRKLRAAAVQILPLKYRVRPPYP